MNLNRYDRDYRGDLIPRTEGPLCLYSEVHDMSEALTMACDERDSLLAECETLRRKARAFDAIASESVHGIRDKNGDWCVYRDADFDAARPHATGPDLLTAVEAALAAKETT